MRVCSNAMVNDDSLGNSVFDGTFVVQQFDSSGTIVVHGEQRGAAVPAALES